MMLLVRSLGVVVVAALVGVIIWRWNAAGRSPERPLALAAAPAPLLPEADAATPTPDAPSVRSATAEVERVQVHRIQLRASRTACASGTSTTKRRYRGEPLAKFSIRVPTNARSPVEFDFCVDEVRFDEKVVAWDAGGIVRASDNPFGLQGPWFTFGDDVTVWELPKDGLLGHDVEPGGALCIKGVAPQVFEDRFDDYWGAGLGFHLRQLTPAQIELHEPSFDTITVVLRGRKIPALLGYYIDDDQRRGTQPTSWCQMRAVGEPGSSRAPPG